MASREKKQLGTKQPTVKKESEKIVKDSELQKQDDVSPKQKVQKDVNSGKKPALTKKSTGIVNLKRSLVGKEASTANNPSADAEPNAKGKQQGITKSAPPLKPKRYGKVGRPPGSKNRPKLELPKQPLSPRLCRANKLVKQEVKSPDETNEDSTTKLQKQNVGLRKLTKVVTPTTEVRNGTRGRNTPYVTRSDSPARILRNGKRRKLKDPSLLEGLDLGLPKRRRLLSTTRDGSGSEFGSKSEPILDDQSSIAGSDISFNDSPRLENGKGNWDSDCDSKAAVDEVVSGDAGEPQVQPDTWLGKSISNKISELINRNKLLQSLKQSEALRTAKPHTKETEVPEKDKTLLITNPNVCLPETASPKKTASVYVEGGTQTSSPENKSPPTKENVPVKASKKLNTQEAKESSHRNGQNPLIDISVKPPRKVRELKAVKTKPPRLFQALPSSSGMFYVVQQTRNSPFLKEDPGSGRRASADVHMVTVDNLKTESPDVSTVHTKLESEQGDMKKEHGDFKTDSAGDGEDGIEITLLHSTLNVENNNNSTCKSEPLKNLIPESKKLENVKLLNVKKDFDVMSHVRENCTEVGSAEPTIMVDNNDSEGGSGGKTLCLDSENPVSVSNNVAEIPETAERVGKQNISSAEQAAAGYESDCSIQSVRRSSRASLGKTREALLKCLKPKRKYRRLSFRKNQVADKDECESQSSCITEDDSTMDSADVNLTEKLKSDNNDVRSGTVKPEKKPNEVINQEIRIEIKDCRTDKDKDQFARYLQNLTSDTGVKPKPEVVKNDSEGEGKLEEGSAEDKEAESTSQQSEEELNIPSDSCDALDFAVVDNTNDSSSVKLVKKEIGESLSASESRQEVITNEHEITLCLSSEEDSSENSTENVGNYKPQFGIDPTTFYSKAKKKLPEKAVNCTEEKDGMATFDSAVPVMIDSEMMAAVGTKTTDVVDTITTDAVDTKTTDEVDTNAADEVDTNAMIEVDSDTTPEIHTNTVDSVDSDTIPEVHTNTVESVDSDTSDVVNTTTSVVDPENTDGVDMNTTGVVDANTTALVDTITTVLVDTIAPPVVDTDATTVVDTDTTAKVVATTGVHAVVDVESSVDDTVVTEDQALVPEEDDSKSCSQDVFPENTELEVEQQNCFTPEPDLLHSGVNNEEEEGTDVEKAIEELFQEETGMNLEPPGSDSKVMDAVVEEGVSPEEQANKESVLSALGLQPLRALQADAVASCSQSIARNSSYTGTLKTVIKLQRMSPEKRKSLKLVVKNGKARSSTDGADDNVGEEDEEFDYEGDDTVKYSISKETDISETSKDCTGSRKAVKTPHSYHIGSKPQAIPEKSCTSDQQAQESKDDKASGSKQSANLVIPEKSSSFSIHPGRLCNDVCSYCFGKFGSLDTPCHIAQLKSHDRQQKILEAETHLTADSCLCDACYRHVDRKANCPSYKPNRKRQYHRPNSSQIKSRCCAQGCTQTAHHHVRRKWLIKLKRSISKKVPIDMDKMPPHLPFPLCLKHFSWVDYYMVCGICKRRLTRNHMYALGQEVHELNVTLASDGIPVHLTDKLFLCKLCRYYSTVRLKYKNTAQSPGNHKSFILGYRKRILQYHEIEEGDDETIEEAPVKPKRRKTKPSSTVVRPEGEDENGTKSKPESEEMSPGDRSGASTPTIDYSTLGNGTSNPNITVFEFPTSDKQGLKIVERGRPPKIKVKLGCPSSSKNGCLSSSPEDQSVGPSIIIPERDGLEVTPLPDSVGRPFYPGEDELRLHAAFDFNERTEESKRASWGKCTASIQFDKETKQLFQRLQRPYGNHSSFFRHLVLLEKYWRSGDLMLSPGASTRASTYINSVQNRIHAFEGRPPSFCSPYGTTITTAKPIASPVATQATPVPVIDLPLKRKHTGGILMAADGPSNPITITSVPSVSVSPQPVSFTPITASVISPVNPRFSGYTAIQRNPSSPAPRKVFIEATSSGSHFQTGRKIPNVLQVMAGGKSFSLVPSFSQVRHIQPKPRPEEEPPTFEPLICDVRSLATENGSGLWEASSSSKRSSTPLTLLPKTSTSGISVKPATIVTPTGIILSRKPEVSVTPVLEKQDRAKAVLSRKGGINKYKTLSGKLELLKTKVILEKNETLLQTSVPD